MGVRTCMRRLARLAFVVRAERLCCFMPGPAFTLPVAVILNRFLTDDLVFTLGISISSSPSPPNWQATAAGHAHSRPGRAIRGGCVAEPSGWGKGGGAGPAAIWWS